MKTILSKSNVFIKTLHRNQRRALSFHKNKYVEEWNGIREDTHKVFTINKSNIFPLFLTVVVIPGTLYVVTANIESNRKYDYFNREIIKN
eukprot:maker-scaffold_50-snap-gene-1.1-mRNA-1 protein AED:0.00 eAED:0.00 QI:37/1/1/1/1/1/2/17/89